MNIDSRQVNNGCLGLRMAEPPVLLMIYNARALVLEDFVRLLRKLTECRKLGTTVCFHYTPEHVLDGQRIERERELAASMSMSKSGSAAVPHSVANVLGAMYMSTTARSHSLSDHSLSSLVAEKRTCVVPSAARLNDADDELTSPFKTAPDV